MDGFLDFKCHCNLQGIKMTSEAVSVYKEAANRSLGRWKGRQSCVNTHSAAASRKYNSIALLYKYCVLECDIFFRKTYPHILLNLMRT